MIVASKEPGTYSTIYIASPIVVWWRNAHLPGKALETKSRTAEEARHAP